MCPYASAAICGGAPGAPKLLIFVCVWKGRWKTRAKGGIKGGYIGEKH